MENSVTTVAEMRKLLPLSKEEFEVHMPIDVYQEELKAEPSWNTILERLVPNYINGFIYGALVESYASEHNSRMMAMQSATAGSSPAVQSAAASRDIPRRPRSRQCLPPARSAAFPLSYIPCRAAAERPPASTRRKSTKTQTQIGVNDFMS